MGLDKKGYYTPKDIKKLKAQYNIVLGERAPGKSYGIKADCLKRAWESGKPSLILLRRYELDIKTDYATAYFADNARRDNAPGDIYAMTDGEYDRIAVFQGKIYFANVDDKGKFIYGQQCGKTMALNLDERYKSQQHPDVTDIIYEEFVTRDVYLRGECERLQNLVSTIARDRHINVWMIANTISRVCPYFQEWGLRNIPKMEPGTIDTYKIDETLIAVEFCKSRGNKSKMFFGEVAKSIQGGAWETHTVPHLPKAYINYDVLYEMYVRDSGFTFKLELLMDPEGDQLIYVYPYTKTIKDDLVVLTDEFSTSSIVRPFLSKARRAELTIAGLYAQGKICYASNLCGADFKAVVLNMKGGLLAR